MKKTSMIALCALCLTLPTAAHAQDLPDMAQAVSQGVREGLTLGAVQASEAMAQELTLTLSPQDARLEEGERLTLTVTAGNPRPVETPVTIHLTLPERLSLTEPAVWDAVLPAAQMDEQTGALTPSVTTFTREIALKPGGDSETAQLEAEMSMGTRFYRAQTALSLCVADIRADARLDGASDGRARPGDALTYVLTAQNAGTAAKDVPMELVLPEGLTLADALPQGFTQTGNRITGTLRVEAAQAEVEGMALLSLPVRVDVDVLAADEDAMRVLAGQLRVDGARVPLPRVQVCGPLISARLIAPEDDMAQGEEAVFNIVVVNAGLMEADVRVRCMLPQGITLADMPQDEADAPEDDAPVQAVQPPDDAAPGAVVLLTAEGERLSQPVRMQDDGSLVFDLHMDAAHEEDGAAAAATRVVALRVRAEAPQENMREQLLGASLAWQTNDGEAELGEAVAVRVIKPMFLGLTSSEWTGLLWAGLLLILTVSCLYAAVCADNRKREEYISD